jgi:hypothetical protein
VRAFLRSLVVGGFRSGVFAASVIGAVAVGCHREAAEERVTATAIAIGDATRSSDADIVPKADADTMRADADTGLADAADDNTYGKVPDPSNKMKPPLTSADLDERAAHLLDAIAQNDPAKADDFFFPKGPFIPLKDVADPGRYFDQLLATYHRDIRSLSAERKDWTGAAFVSFELGTTPTWVAPGKEYNKVGYFRTFGGKLRYRIGDRVKELAVSTIISWNERWYVTHLLPIRH